MALEMGKPLAQGVGEAEKCAWVCDYYAEHGAAFLADEPRPSDASRSYIRFEALGPVLAIMPWNFPFWQVFRFAAPALVAGNAGILKHAPNVPRCAVAIEEVFQDAGFPDGLFRAVFLSNARASGVIADERGRAVTLTGGGRCDVRGGCCSAASSPKAGALSSRAPCSSGWSPGCRPSIRRRSAPWRR